MSRRASVRNRASQLGALEPEQGITPPAQRVASEAVRPQNDPWLQQVLTQEEMAAVGEVRQAQQGLRPRMHSQHEREQKAVFQQAVARADERKIIAAPLENSRVRRRRNGGAHPGEVFVGGRATPLTEAEMLEKGMMLPPAKVEVQQELINGEQMVWGPPAGDSGGTPLIQNVDGVNVYSEPLVDAPVVTQQELEDFAAAQEGGYDDDYAGDEVEMSAAPLTDTSPAEEKKTVPVPPPVEPMQKKTVAKSSDRKNKTEVKTKGKSPKTGKKAGEKSQGK